MWGGTLDGAGGYVVLGELGLGGSFQVLGSSTLGVAEFVLDAGEVMSVSNSLALNGTQLVNRGQITWNAGHITCSNGVGIHNEGYFNVLVDDPVFLIEATPGTPSVLNNYGVVAHMGGSASVRITYNAKPGSFNEVASGTLFLARDGAGGVAEAPFWVNAGATLFVSRDTTYDFRAGAAFTGAGVVEVQGVLQVQEGLAVTASPEFRLISTIISTPKVKGLAANTSFTTTGLFVWSGGALETLGFFEAQGDVTIRSRIEKTVTNATFRSYVSVFWYDSGNIKLASASIENYGMFSIWTNAGVEGGSGSGFTNKTTGTVRIMQDGNNDIDVAFVNWGTVLLNGMPLNLLRGALQNGGTSLTDLGGGTLRIGPAGDPALFDLLAGTLKGGGTLIGNLFNTAGTVKVGDNPLARDLNLNGDYTQSGLGLLDIAFWQQGNDWLFGKLVVSGTATLSGNVAFTGMTGGMPLNTSGVFLSAATRNGTLVPPEQWTVLPLGDSLIALWEGEGGGG